MENDREPSQESSIYLHLFHGRVYKMCYKKKMFLPIISPSTLDPSVSCQQTETRGVTPAAHNLAGSAVIVE